MGFFSKKGQQAKSEIKNEISKSEHIEKPKYKPNLNNPKETMGFKCEQFFGKNWKFVGSFIGISMLVMAYQIGDISSKMDELTKVVYENNGKVVLTTTDGRALKVVKEPLKAEYLKQFAVSTFVNNFIVSKSQLTNNFEKIQFSNPSEVLDNVPSLRMILKNYIDTPQGAGDIKAYSTWLISAVVNDKLPEYIALKDYSLDRYEYNQNKYELEISIKVIAQSWIIAKNEYVAQNGVIKIKANGSFDLGKSNDINPYGMRIDRLIITPVIKAFVRG
ncbi:hypothetical protein LMG7974_01604 [Campylobacter majalis]|uniref:Bacterial virulence protein VirB8 domain-containing protein n=1 Tax=Campylobacter majalis TaxID=2790656 RepID=A0ABM8Q9U8_9BACT|nr:hypothetical protein [Campylobacter majalis]CAD7289527.1 hypothetical protein LMG7974_01604 [Campylobacter majalis]